MEPNSKILILQIKHPKALREKSKLRPIYRTRLYLVAFFVRFLGFFGYQFKTIDEAMQEKQGKFVCLTFDSNHRNLFRVIYPWLKSRNIPATLNIATDEIGHRHNRSKTLTLGHTPVRLSWKNMEELVKSGWEIGARGRHKETLIEMSYKDQLENIRSARSTLIKKLGVEPKVFSYPRGAYDSTSIKCLRDAGFKYGLSLHQGGNTSESSHMHLKRLTVQSIGLRTIVKVATHALRPTKTMKNSLKNAKVAPTKVERGVSL